MEEVKDNFKDGDFITDGIRGYIFKQQEITDTGLVKFHFHCIAQGDMEEGSDVTFFNQIREVNVSKFKYSSEEGRLNLLIRIDILGKCFDEDKKEIFDVNFEPNVGEEYFYPDIYSITLKYGSCIYDNRLANALAVKHRLAFKYKEGAIRKCEEIHGYNSSRRDW